MIHYSSQSIKVFQSVLYQTNSTVIETENLILVVDPNWLPNEIEEIKNYIKAKQNNKPIYLLFTHSDYDHIIGYKAIENVITIASVDFANNERKDEIIEQIRSFDDQYYIKRNYKIEYPKIDHIIFEDGQKLMLGDTTITFYKANGHTEDGLFAVIEPLGLFIAGDYLSDVEFPFIFTNSYDYEKTLLKINDILKKHKVELLIPGHGNVGKGVNEILKRQNDSLNYILKLREQLKNNKPIDNLIQDYSFPRFLKKMHQENVDIIKKELENNEYKIK